MIFTYSLGIVDALFCCGLASAVLLLKPRSLSQWSFLAGMTALGAESAFDALGIQAVSPAETLDWQRLRLVATALIPGIWLTFSLCYSRGNYREFLRRWWLMVAAAFFLPLALVVGFPEQLITKVQAGPNVGKLLGLGWPGFALNLV